MFGTLKPGFRSLATLKLVSIIGRTLKEINSCGIARFPCDSMAFLFVSVFSNIVTSSGSNKDDIRRIAGKQRCYEWCKHNRLFLKPKTKLFKINFLVSLTLYLHITHYSQYCSLMHLYSHLSPGDYIWWNRLYCWQLPDCARIVLVKRLGVGESWLNFTNVWSQDAFIKKLD